MVVEVEIDEMMLSWAIKKERNESPGDLVKFLGQAAFRKYYKAPKYFTHGDPDFILNNRSIIVRTHESNHEPSTGYNHSYHTLVDLEDLNKSTCEDLIVFFCAYSKVKHVIWIYGYLSRKKLLRAMEGGRVEMKKLEKPISPVNCYGEEWERR